jgi:hypothetical protein
MSDDFDVITGPAAPLRPVPPASLPPAPQPAPAPPSRKGKPEPGSAISC